MRIASLPLFLLALAPAMAHADPAETYATMCSTCHGAGGAGDGEAAAALPDKPPDFTSAEFAADRTDDVLLKVIKEGGAAAGKSPLMAPYGGIMSDEQIKEMVAYIKTFSTQEEPAPAPAPAPAP